MSRFLFTAKAIHRYLNFCTCSVSRPPIFNLHFGLFFLTNRFLITEIIIKTFLSGQFQWISIWKNAETLSHVCPRHQSQVCFLLKFPFLNLLIFLISFSTENEYWDRKVIPNKRYIKAQKSKMWPEVLRFDFFFWTYFCFRSHQLYLQWLFIFLFLF